MKAVLIHGALHKGSTYEISRQFISQLALKDSDIMEFFLPKDMSSFCIGCSNCFMKGEEFCPHKSQLQPIITAMDQADLLIFTSPVYVLHTTGQMKTLLDHFGYRFIVHRPNPLMFKKTALIISTAAGSGMKSTNKDIKDSLTFWGVGSIFTYGKAVYAIKWDEVSAKTRNKIQGDVVKLTSKISKSVHKKNTSIKVKFLFHMMRFMHKHFSFNKVDHDYWLSKGWLKKARPWKN
jgi:multimeric flavodoxin WrbA